MNRFFISFSLILIPLGLSATPLTWDKCVEILRKNNEELHSQIASLQASQYSEGVAQSGFLPQISAGLSYAHTETQAPTESKAEGYGANLNISQNLFSGMSDFYSRRSAAAGTLATLKDLEYLKARLSKDLKVSFQNYRFAQDSIELKNSIVQRRQENLRLVELRFQGGRENKGSVLLSKATLSEAKLEVLQARLQLRAAQAALAKLLGIEDYEGLHVVGDVPTSEPPKADIKLLPLASLTPAFQKAQAIEASAEANFKIKQSSFFPKLNLNAGLNRGDDDFFPERDKNWSLGLTLTIPLFQGGSDYYQTKAQGQILLGAIKQRVQAQRSGLVNLETTLGDLIQQDERVRVNKEFVEAVSVQSEIGRMRYNNGLITFENWYTIENDLIARQKNLLESKRDRVQREAAWEEAQGKGVL